MKRSATLLGAGLLALAIPRPAAAHIEITSHETRHGVGQQKLGPCGAPGSGPGETVYSYAPGETIELTWNEFVDHPGHYRIAFDPSGADGFVDPSSADDLDNSPLVVLDGIPDLPGVHDYAAELSLPELECETCTIQILQVMTDKPPFGDGNDLYYHCIDVRLRADAGTDTDSGGQASSEAQGCAIGGTIPGAGLLLLLFSLVAIARRP